jgi:hypothetical protein
MSTRVCEVTKNLFTAMEDETNGKSPLNVGVDGKESCPLLLFVLGFLQPFNQPPVSLVLCWSHVPLDQNLSATAARNFTPGCYTSTEF